VTKMKNTLLKKIALLLMATFTMGLFSSFADEGPVPPPPPPHHQHHHHPQPTPPPPPPQD